MRGMSWRSATRMAAVVPVAAAVAMMFGCPPAAPTTTKPASGGMAVGTEVTPPLPPASADGWRDLTGTVDLKKHVVAGSWAKDAGGLNLSAGEFSTLSVPFVPQGSYELEVKWKRTSGTDGVLIAFPMGAKQGNLNIGGWNNGVSGLEVLDGKTAAQQDDGVAAKKQGIEEGKEYTYVIRVEPKGDKVAVVVTVDGKDFVKWEGLQSAVGMSSEWNVKGRNIVLGAHGADVVFKSARVKIIGEGKLTYEPVKW